MTETQEQELLANAVDYYYAADFTQAIELFEKVLVINPNNQSAIEYIEKATTNKGLAENVARFPREAVLLVRLC
jgi:tetratricopeptide (TPR) repeat protein